MGWAGYNPYWYAGTYWGWGRYGYWYDPFYFGGYYSGGGGSDDEPRENRVRLGSIRLKVNPGHAKVYVDGVLYGVASEFSGLSGHLKLDPGRAVLELQAEGYETLRREIVVEPGRTMTERVTLTRIK
jgi:hypothetical protein